MLIESNEVEQDTFEDEEITNVVQFILPSASILSNSFQFGMSYNRFVFDGWVKQPSPCCAAAAVAGAWNSLFHFHRRQTSSLSHLDVLHVSNILIVILLIIENI